MTLEYVTQRASLSNDEALVVLDHFHLVGSEGVLPQLEGRNEGPKNLIKEQTYSPRHAM